MPDLSCGKSERYVPVPTLELNIICKLCQLFGVDSCPYSRKPCSELIYERLQNASRLTYLAGGRLTGKCLLVVPASAIELYEKRSSLGGVGDGSEILLFRLACCCLSFLFFCFCLARVSQLRFYRLPQILLDTPGRPCSIL